MIFEEAVRFFCRASLSCFASGAKYQQLGDSPWKKHIIVEEGDFKLEDIYWSFSYSPYSTGETVIYCKNQPYWIMQYGGFYLEEAIPCLRSALKEAYASFQFCGGRGLRSHPHGRYLYTNLYHGDFECFSGREDVFSYVAGSKSEVLGYHTYQGWLL